VTQKPVFLEGIFTLRNVRSMGAAALIEILIVLGVAGVLLWQRLQPPVEQPRLPIIDPAPDVPQVPLRPRTVPRPDQPQTPHLSEVPSVPTAIPGPGVQPVEPPQAPLLPLPQPPAELVNAFAARMLRAIEARKVYPGAALLKGETGETVVSFDYVDGVVGQVRVERSSGFHDLDQAAVDAVKQATLPAKPPELAGLTHFEFHLVFDLGG
jgi:protein TonB